jgi:hypothetical protein
MFSRRPRLSRHQMLDSVPHLNPAVRITELDTGRAMVVYEKGGNGAVRLLRILFAVPETSELLLDEAGTKIVRQVDGKATIAELIAYAAGEFRLSRKESEVAVLKYMDTLGRRGLVGFEVRGPRKGK